MSRPSITFVCDAEVSIGFGHLSRCLRVAELLRRDCVVRFCGRFSPEARGRLARHRFPVVRPPARGTGGLAVIDTMFDARDMDAYDLPRLEDLRKRFAKMVVVSSALTVPSSVPADVVIGHLLRPRRPAPSFRLFAGLRFAPVSSDLRGARGRRKPESARIARVFLGFGASPDIRGLRCVLEALERRNFTGDVDLLLSPFHRRFTPVLQRLTSPYTLRIHSNVPSVGSLLARADVAFGTYGNITFEALCVGVPFLAVAVKDFQRTYAERLGREGLLVSLGRDSALRPGAVSAALDALTVERRRRLRRNGRKAVDGLGIGRIARVVEREARDLALPAPGVAA